ncbi:MAG: radical SAM protein [Pseudomonadota bacterium]
MRIILADPPRREAYYDNSYPNVGILYLIAYLRQYCASPPELIYLEGDCTLQGHLDFIQAHKPDVYGLSFAMWTADLAYKTLSAVKERFPEVLTVCGGPEPTANYDLVFQNSTVDICVLGEGEATFKHLVETLQAGGDTRQVPGLAIRQDGGSLLTPKRELIHDLEDIPLPAWDMVDLSKYTGMHINKANPQTHMLVSRGCPFDCNFCANPVWKLSKPWVRMRRPEGIAREVKLLYDKGVREIYMTSDEFNVSEKWALEVCQAIKALGLGDLYFQCNLRADNVSAQLAQAFAGINLWLIHLGIESGNQRTLDGIGKHITLAQIERTCQLMQAAGVKIFGFVMLFHAWEEDGQLQWETAADVHKTLDFCRQLLSRKLIQYMSWQVATPMPGSRLYATAKKFNLIPNKRITGVWAQNLLLPGVQAGEVKKALRRGMLLKNYYLLKNGNINLSHLSRALRNLKVIFGRPQG